MADRSVPNTRSAVCVLHLRATPGHRPVSWRQHLSLSNGAASADEVIDHSRSTCPSCVQHSLRVGAILGQRVVILFPLQPILPIQCIDCMTPSPAACGRVRNGHGGAPILLQCRDGPRRIPSSINLVPRHDASNSAAKHIAGASTFSQPAR